MPISRPFYVSPVAEAIVRTNLSEEDRLETAAKVLMDERGDPEVFIYTSDMLPTLGAIAQRIKESAASDQVDRRAMHELTGNLAVRSEAVALYPFDNEN